MKAYIHIGTHKAGSTTIQDYFSQAAPLFGDKLLYYPFGYNLAQKIRDKELTIRMIPHMIPSLEEDLTKTGAKSVFLSGEAFLGDYNSAYSEAYPIARFVEALFSNFEVYIT